ncbi:MAG: hypothetical protein HY682_03135, partial [Chloroflexi bacterium]|nr:hypothetical protein [Chloroflexota bacterium]
MAISQPPMMAAAPPQTDRHLHYLVYGQRLCSNMPLPELPRARFDVRDMGFRASVSSSGGSLLPDGAVLRSRHETNLGCELLVYDAPGAHVLRWQGQCDFLISRDGVLIEWRAAPGVVPEWVNSTLYGVVMSYVLHIRGVGNLHASAVALPSGVIGFLADPGGGKSTLAASFAARGYPLVTDDLFALQRSGEGYAALPGFPYVSLSPASAGAVVPGTHASAAPMGGEQGVFVDDPAEG